jgi:nucleoside-diphosphate-sugar epimerase
MLQLPSVLTGWSRSRSACCIATMGHVGLTRTHPSTPIRWRAGTLPPRPMCTDSRRRAGRASFFALDGSTGPGAAHSEQLFALARRHLGLVLGPPDSYVSSIHVADAGAAVAAALHAPTGTFNIVDDQPLTKRQYADAIARAAGTTMWLRGPGRVASIFRDKLTSLSRSLRVSNARFIAATGWAPRYPSAREGWIATAEALRQP